MLAAEGLLLTAYEVVPSGNLLGMKLQGFTAQTGFVPQLRSLQPLNSRPEGHMDVTAFRRAARDYNFLGSELAVNPDPLANGYAYKNFACPSAERLLFDSSLLINPIKTTHQTFAYLASHIS